MQIKYLDNILETIGSTPIVRLNHLTNHANIYAKLEYFNPGGSIKDRAALFMIEDAERKGLLKKEGTIIEPTAGNTGIGLALVASQKNYDVIFVVPDRFSKEKQTLMEALGAKIITTPTSNGIEGAIEKAIQLSKEIPNSYVPQQFSNTSNSYSHYVTTAKEIYQELSGKIDIFVAGVGTGGTFTGVAKFLKENLSHVKTIAVEPKGSSLGKGKPGSHKIEGIGVDDLNTVKILDKSLIDEVITVRDEDAHHTLKFLARYEGMLVGSSSGAAAFASKLVAERYKDKNLNIVTILPDGSERYLSKNIYGDFDEWKK